MPGRKRLIKNEDNYISLRTSPNGNHQSYLNVITVGLFTAHLIEREYSVYTRMTANQELIIRIYNGEDRYELTIYPHEDARPIVIEACRTLGGAPDMEKLIGFAHKLEASQEGPREARKT